MSCNGCRVLRKGCNENCVLRQSLRGIESPRAQSNATLFIAKFFGRAGLISFLSAVPEPQRPALFQSLLFDACGRAVNPVSGAVGLLWTGNWHVCQAAVETVLRGGTITATGDLASEVPVDVPDDACDTSNIDFFGSAELHSTGRANDFCGTMARPQQTADLDISPAQLFPARMAASRRVNRRRKKSPSGNSDESEMTNSESNSSCQFDRAGGGSETKLLRLFF
ncbi:hypothetical protein NMG60_11019774 [Bertholletia excelsa]